MNEESSINQWIDSAARQLVEAQIPSSRLDAELIMSHTLRKSRTYLHAHGDEGLTDRHHEIADARLRLRLDRTPLAYIIGHKEFYGRTFSVTPATLIPRPESEDMVDLLKEAMEQPKLPLPSETRRLADVGTGSGCLGITAKLEFPELEVTLLDISRHALNVAENNAKRLGADATVLRSDLLQSYPYKADFIFANLPYVDKSWEVSPEVRHEPEEALFAAEEGLSLIYRLLSESKSRLNPKGTLFIEADSRQHTRVKTHAKENGFSLTSSKGLILAFRLT